MTRRHLLTPDVEAEARDDLVECCKVLATVEPAIESHAAEQG